MFWGFRALGFRMTHAQVPYLSCSGMKRMTHYLLGLEGAFGKLSCLAVPFLIPLTRNPSYSAFAPSLRNSWTTWVLLQSSTAMHQRIVPTMDMFPLMVVDVLNCARKYWLLVTQIWNYIHIITTTTTITITITIITIIMTSMIINLRSVFSTKFDGPFSPRFGYASISQSASSSRPSNSSTKTCDNSSVHIWRTFYQAGQGKLQEFQPSFSHWHLQGNHRLTT